MSDKPLFAPQDKMAEGVRERDAILGVEDRGDIVGPVKRDPSGDADFLDEGNNDQPWDVKAFNSNFSNGFDPTTAEIKIQTSIEQQGENVVLDTRNLSAQDLETLQSIVAAHPEWAGKILWYP